MTLTKNVPIVIGVVGLTVAGCSRTDTTENRFEPAADEAQARQNETMELDNRLAAVEREWQDAQAALSQKASAASAEVKARIQDDLEEAREAIAELRTTTADNWWERSATAIRRSVGTYEASPPRPVLVALFRESVVQVANQPEHRMPTEA